MKRLFLALLLITMACMAAGYSGSTAAADFTTEGSLANHSSDVVDHAENSSFKTDVMNFLESLPFW